MNDFRTACGGDCGCGGKKQDADPYQESLEAVWHDPSQYDPLKHGPSYMKTASLSPDQKAQVRKSASKANSRLVKAAISEGTPLSGLLAVLRAAVMIHQTHHWQTGGGHYYADHLLFDRLYTESQDFIDHVAERAVGLKHSGVVDASTQASTIAMLVGQLGNRGVLDPEVLMRSSLQMERIVLKVVDTVISILESQGELTNGTDNLLQGIADLHETFVYLLQQRTQSPLA